MSRALYGDLPGFVALLFGASQLFLERFDGGRLGLQLCQDAIQLHLPLLFTLARLGYEQFFLLLRFYPRNLDL